MVAENKIILKTALVVFFKILSEYFFGSSDRIFKHPGHESGMRRLTTGIAYEKCIVRRFRLCVYVILCTYTNLDSTVLPTTHLGCVV
jgi:hypothetical protein